MTPAEIMRTIAESWESSRNYHNLANSQHSDALAIVEELVSRGLATDDRIGPLSLEARIVTVLDRMERDYEGCFTRDDVGAEVAFALGLVSHVEASEYAGVIA